MNSIMGAYVQKVSISLLIEHFAKNPEILSCLRQANRLKSQQAPDCLLYRRRGPPSHGTYQCMHEKLPSAVRRPLFLYDSTLGKPEALSVRAGGHDHGQLRVENLAPPREN